MCCIAFQCLNHDRRPYISKSSFCWRSWVWVRWFGSCEQSRKILKGISAIGMPSPLLAADHRTGPRLPSASQGLGVAASCVKARRVLHRQAKRCLGNLYQRLGSPAQGTPGATGLGPEPPLQHAGPATTAQQSQVKTRRPSLSSARQKEIFWTELTKRPLNR